MLWSRHDTDKIGVAVDGWQCADGQVTRAVSLYDTDKELTAADARLLAAALLDAADQLDRIEAIAACSRCDGDGYHPGGEDGDPIRCFHDGDA